jgi:hypothetical protein
MKTVYIAATKPNNTKYLQKQGIRDKIASGTMIKTDGIRLTLQVRASKIKIFFSKPEIVDLVLKKT